MFNPVDRIQEIADLYKGTHSFGYGTLAELNAPNDMNYPVIWIVAPITLTDVALDSESPRTETWQMIMRVVDSGRLADTLTDKQKTFNLTKMIGDGILYKLLDSDDITLGNIIKQQIWLQADDVHIGWEYRFNLIISPDIDYCCQPFNA